MLHAATTATREAWVKLRDVVATHCGAGQYLRVIVGLLREGEAHFEAGRLDEAERCFQQILDAEPGHSEALNNLGVLAWSRGDESAAIERFVHAVEGEPFHRASLVNLADVMVAVGQAALAVPLLDRYLAEHPDDVELRATRARCEDPHAETPADDDPYMARVRPELRASKTGMNVLVFADWNTAGQLTRLADALNQYTRHKARCVILYDDFLQYGRDVLVYDGGKTPAQGVLDEVATLVKRADFFHVGNEPIDLPGIPLRSLVNGRNCLCQYFGSHLRTNSERLFLWHTKTDIAALVGFGWTLKFPLPRRFYHIQQFMGAFDDWRVAPLEAGQTVRIVHAPTNRKIKKTDVFLAAVERIARDHPIEVDVIEKTPHDECMARKRVGHICYDEMGTPTFGLTSVESLTMGQVCLSSVCGYVRSYFPDLPLVRVTEETIEPILRRLVQSPALVNRIGDLGYEWVRRHYNAETSAKRFGHLYEGISNGFFHTTPGLPDGLLP